MLCKSESRDPEHCLKEGRRVTRCAIDLYVGPLLSGMTIDSVSVSQHY